MFEVEQNPSRRKMASSSSSSLLRVSSLHFMVLFVSHFFPSTTQQTTGPTPLFPAVYIFGDSIVDPGNNNELRTSTKSNFPPYGKDFLGGRPTGRFSNGKIPGDLLAERLGLKEFLNSYLNTDLSEFDMLTGVSFASGGSGFDPMTPELMAVIPMETQLDLFRQYLRRLIDAVGSTRTFTIISEALFIVCAGTDDIANTYFTASQRRTQYDINNYLDMVVNLAGRFLQNLSDLGARKIGVVGLPPIGCLPSQRTLGGGIARQCDDARNAAANMYNTKMVNSLSSLQISLPQTKFQFLDIFPTLMNITQTPQQYGFLEVTRGCCGTGAYEAAMTCNPRTPITCFDDTKFLFWDSYHLTESGYNIVVDVMFTQLLQGPLV